MSASSNIANGNPPANGHPQANGQPSDGEKQKSSSSDVGKAPKSKQPLSTRIKQLWLAKTGIDLRTYEQMFKGALAPTIAISAYQATPYAETYTTIGYLVGIMSILSLPIQPRAKFLQTMFINLIAAGLGAAVALLAMFCCVKARINTEGFHGAGTGGPGTSGLAAGGAATATYNSSASAVAGIWLFVQIYGISVMRARLPQLTIPSILFAIFANVSMVYAPQFSTMTQAASFAKRLLEAFLTGFAISTGVSLLVFPLTSRQVVFKETTGYIASLRAAMQANLNYLTSMEDTDIFAPHRVNTAGDQVPGSREADAFKARMQALVALQAKFHMDLPFAKREIALGKLGPDDLQQIQKLLRGVMLPIVGLSCLPEAFQRIAEERGWDPSLNFAHASLDDAPNNTERIRIETIQEWHELMKILRRPFGKITETIDKGLEHVAITLQLAPRPKAHEPEMGAVESGEILRPGDEGFAVSYNTESHAFLDSKKEMLRAWCAIHNIELSDDFFADPYAADFKAPDWMNETDGSFEHGRVRRQLFLSLYMEFLLFNISRRVYDFILFAEKLQSSGKLSKTRIVVPGFKRLQKWVVSIFVDGGDGTQDDQQIDTGANEATTVYLGDAYKKRRDPEHLPPQNTWERFSDHLRTVPHFFQSPSSSFGLRVACATMSIAVVAYLHDTQTFFTTERLFWSQIMISISMSPSAGQSLRNFLLRIFGTFAAMCFSYLAYYIVDGKTAGVLVFYFIFLHGGVYIVLKYPQIIPVGMISQVTLTLILGYTLQVRKIGIETATSNGQAYYPIYELAPIRLATVAGGLFLAWIWTIFPYPISEHSQIRQNLGRSLYLLANYYSVLHETVNIRLRGAEGDRKSKDSPGAKLEKARLAVFTKCNVLLTGLRAQSAFVKFDIPIGGKFPRETYQQIVAQMQSALNFMALISIASATFTELQDAADESEHASQWLANLRRIVKAADLTSQQVTTLLSLLSASVTNGSPLPPYLKVPEPYALSERLDQLDRDILSVRHIAEPGYASFAVVQIGTRLMIADLKRIVRSVKELVGELDFSYHVVSTADSRLASEASFNSSESQKGNRNKLD